MKKILKILLCATLFFTHHSPLSTLHYAQAQITHSSQGRLDENATEVLKKAAARFDKNVSFTVTMTVLDSKKEEKVRQSADVCYNKGKYRLSMLDQELICDGATVWHWNKTANEVTINNMVEDDIDLLNPGRLLAAYGKSFKAKYIRTDDDGTAVVDLQPRSTRSFHKIRLFIKEDDGLLCRMEVHKYDSGRENYVISDFKRSSNSASQFTFDTAKHPDVEVIDMR